MSVMPCLLHLVKKLEPSAFIYDRRKAYRLGKWLSDLNTLRNTPVLTKAGSLELLASGGEGVYYFVEQLTWYALLPSCCRVVLWVLCHEL